MIRFFIKHKAQISVSSVIRTHTHTRTHFCRYWLLFVHCAKATIDKRTYLTFNTNHLKSETRKRCKENGQNRMGDIIFHWFVENSRKLLSFIFLALWCGRVLRILHVFTIKGNWLFNINAVSHLSHSLSLTYFFHFYLSFFSLENSTFSHLYLSLNNPESNRIESNHFQTHFSCFSANDMIGVDAKHKYDYTDKVISTTHREGETQPLEMSFICHQWVHKVAHIMHTHQPACARGNKEIRLTSKFNSMDYFLNLKSDYFSGLKNAIRAFEFWERKKTRNAFACYTCSVWVDIGEREARGCAYLPVSLGLDWNWCSNVLLNRSSSSLPVRFFLLCANDIAFHRPKLYRRLSLKDENGTKVKDIVKTIAFYFIPVCRFRSARQYAHNIAQIRVLQSTAFKKP